MTVGGVVTIAATIMVARLAVAPGGTLLVVGHQPLRPEDHRRRGGPRSTTRSCVHCIHLIDNTENDGAASSRAAARVSSLHRLLRARRLSVAADTHLSSTVAPGSSPGHCVLPSLAGCPMVVT